MPFESHVLSIQALWRGAIIRGRQALYYPPGRINHYVYGSRRLYELDHFSVEWDMDDCLGIGNKHTVYLITNTSDCYCDWCYEDIELEKQKYTCSTQNNCDFDICTHCYQHAHEDLWHVIH